MSAEQGSSGLSTFGPRVQAHVFREKGLASSSQMTAARTASRRSFERTLASAKRTMVLSEIVSLAIDSFRTNKVRVMLTSLGMVIGSASLILVFTWPDRQTVHSPFNPGHWDQHGGSGVFRRRTGIERTTRLPQRLPETRG